MAIQESIGKVRRMSTGELAEFGNAVADALNNLAAAINASHAENQRAIAALSSDIQQLTRTVEKLVSAKL